MKNIVYLHTHDTGRCVSPYGYRFDTPHLMRFAGESMVFRKAFDCSPTCSPARSALLTGQHPHNCGMLGLAHRGCEISDKSHHIANFLQSHGYHTVLCGVQHETHDAVQDLGYLENYQSASKPSTGCKGRDAMVHDSEHTQFACDFLKKKNGKHEQPFFLSLGLNSTHREFPIEPDPEDNPDYILPPAPCPNNATTRRDWAGFATLVRHADKCFGKVLQTLREENLMDDTLVLVTTDHGPAFPFMKCTLNENGCGVMFMLHIPGEVQGEATDSLVSHLDFYPTVCDWLGIEQPPWLDGKSLFPVLRKETAEIHEEIFAEITFHAAKEFVRSVRTHRYRYIRRLDNYPKMILPNFDAGLTKTFLLDNAEFSEKKRVPREQLFDLHYDPVECHNLADNPHYSAVLQDLQTRLDNWMVRTQDPLCNPDYDTPENVLLNGQEGLHPIQLF